MLNNKGYGTFRPNEDVDEMTCHYCTSEIISIKTVILFQAEGKIKFHLNKTVKNENDISEFVAAGDQIVIFGDEKAFEEYNYVIIEVLKSSKPHKNIIAGIKNDDFSRQKSPRGALGGGGPSRLIPRFK